MRVPGEVVLDKGQAGTDVARVVWLLVECGETTVSVLGPSKLHVMITLSGLKLRTRCLTGLHEMLSCSDRVLPRILSGISRSHNE